MGECFNVFLSKVVTTKQAHTNVCWPKPEATTTSTISTMSIHSTPRSHKSSQFNSVLSPVSDSGPQNQSRLMKELSRELHMHVWETSADKVAQMLSPKTFNENGPPTYLIDHPAVVKQLQDITDQWSFNKWGWDAAKVEKDTIINPSRRYSTTVSRRATAYTILCAHPVKFANPNLNPNPTISLCWASEMIDTSRTSPSSLLTRK